VAQTLVSAAPRLVSALFLRLNLSGHPRLDIPNVHVTPSYYFGLALGRAPRRVSALQTRVSAPHPLRICPEEMHYPVCQTLAAVFRISTRKESGSSLHGIYTVACRTPAIRLPAHFPQAPLSSGWIGYLDTTREGPMYLALESIARVVVASLRCGEQLKHYDLGAYSVMSNHVHTLLLPLISPSRLIQSIKGVTAREANRILGRTGETFWQAESYDHWVRDEEERGRIAAYIENNPVKAGLVERAEDYCWSSAGERKSAEVSLGAADTSVCATSVHTKRLP
jgi:REP element-mobilizing transposase RayT